MKRILLCALLALAPSTLNAQTSANGVSPTAARTISVTSTSSSIQLGANGTGALLCNTGAVEAFYKLGTGSAPTALTTDFSLGAGLCLQLSVAPSTYIAARTAASTTTIRVTQVFGFAALGGGGSGGGGGGGAVTITGPLGTQAIADSVAVTTSDGSDVTQGAAGDGACGTDAGTGCTVVERLSRIAQNVTASAVTLGTYASPQTSFLSTTPMARSATLTSASVSFNSSGDNTVVTRTTGTVKVHRLLLACASSVVITIKDGASNSLTGAMTATSMYLPFESEPHFATTSTNNFVINLGSGVQCSGRVYYLEN